MSEFQKVPKNVILLGLQFLKELRSIESASKHTLRAYSRDLNQFFDDEKGHKIQLRDENQLGIFFEKNLIFDENDWASIGKGNGELIGIDTPEKISSCGGI